MVKQSEILNKKTFVLIPYILYNSKSLQNFLKQLFGVRYIIFHIFTRLFTNVYKTGLSSLVQG